MPCLVCGDTRGRVLFAKGGKDFVRCRGCGLGWLAPMPTAADVAAYYDGAYRNGIYEAYAAAEPIRRLIAEHRLHAIRARARPGRWLDVGCGAGHFVEVAARAGMAAEGCDLSARAVELGRARGLAVRQTAVEDLAPSAPYDTITAFDVLEHLRDPRAFIARLGCCLVAGGTLVLTLPDVTSIYARLMGRHWFYYAPAHHLFYFDPRTIARLLTAHGFTTPQVTRAYKPLTPAHVAAQLRVFTPALGRVADVVLRGVPRRRRDRPVRCYVGEMLVIATAGGAQPAP